MKKSKRTKYVGKREIDPKTGMLPIIEGAFEKFKARIAIPYPDKIVKVKNAN